MARPAIVAALPPSEQGAVIAELRQAGFDAIAVGSPVELETLLAARRDVAVAILDGESDFDTSLEYYGLLHEAGHDIPALMVVSPRALETMTLGLSASDNVSRVARLRISGDTPLAIERAAISASILPDPEAIGTSLYKHLEKSGNRPVRAVQRIRAVALEEEDAALLEIEPGVASLHIERISYLASGRVVEFTRSIYRGDTYDFVAELRLDTRGNN